MREVETPEVVVYLPQEPNEDYYEDKKQSHSDEEVEFADQLNQ